MRRAELRRAVLRSSRLSGARRRVAMAASPALREGIGRTSHRRRFTCARWILPGSIAQIPDEIVGFGRLAASRQPVRMGEIGTQHGGTSFLLCWMAPSVRNFVGIDIRPDNVELVEVLAPAAVDVAFLVGSSRDSAIRGQLASCLEGELLDVLFIDGDHSYNGARADLEEYRAFVRPGGLIAFHDIRPDAGGVQVNPLAWSGGVPQLWQEIKARFSHWEFINEPAQNGYGIGVIEHDPSVALEAPRGSSLADVSAH